MIADQNGIDFGTKACRFGYFSGPSSREAQFGWLAAWLVGWGRPAGHMGCMLFIHLGVLLVGGLVGGLAGWLAARLNGWLGGWQVGWLAGWNWENSQRIVNQNCVDFCLKTCRFGHLLAHPRGTHMLAGRLGGRLVGWLATTLRQKCGGLHTRYLPQQLSYPCHIMT